MEYAGLVELLDIAATGGAVIRQTLRILRESFEKISQLLRMTGRDVDAELSLSERERQLALRGSDRDYGFRFREETEELAREKRIPGSDLLRDEANVRIDEQGAIIPTSL